MFEVFKEAKRIIAERKREEFERNQLLNANTDLGMLERFVQKVNRNPGLRIKITTKDGAVYEIYTIDKHATHTFEHIDGNKYE